MTDTICFICEMRKYPLDKMLDLDFLTERKNEFFPEEEFGDYASVCEKCHDGLIEYYLK
jgi:hypothetical protein